MNESPRKGRRAAVPHSSFPAPPDLRVTRVRLGGEPYLLLSHELPIDRTPDPPAAVGATSAQMLTPAERAVAALVARGLSNEQIAQARGASARTVANQLASIYRKLGISSRLELVGRLS